MTARVAAICWLRQWLACVGLFCIALGAGAAQLQVLIDSDNDSATGCTVSVPGGSFAGVEWVLDTVVDPTATPPSVGAVTRRQCVAPATNTLGPPTPVSPGGWNVGLGQGVDGFDVIETFFTTTATYGTYRLGFVYEDPAIGSDVLVSTDDTFGGPPITFFLGQAPGPIPALTDLGLLLLAALLSGAALFVLRRHRAHMVLVVAALAVFLTTSTWAAIVLDGLINDWNGVPPLAMDDIGDAPPGTDMSAAFAAVEPGAYRVYFRADVKVKSAQTISFTSAPPPGAKFGGPTYDVTAAATSGLPIALTIDAVASTVCSIAGSTVSFIGAGTCVIDANQAGNAQYNPAPQVQQSFAVGKADQSISFTSAAPVAASVGGPTYSVSVNASSGLAVTLTVDPAAAAICSIAGATVSFIGAGTCVIDADQAGDGNYNAAPQAQQSFAVGKGSQAISFTSAAPVAAVVGGATYTATATGGASGNPVTFTIDASATSVCSIAGSIASFIGAGTCVIDADQAGDGNYNAAPQAQQSFAVGKAGQTISFTSSAPSDALVGGPTYGVTATATSGLAVSFTIDASAVGVCSIAGSTVSFIGAGTCVIDADQPGNATYGAAPQVQQSFAVKGTQTVGFTSVAPAAAVYQGATYAVAATATSGLVVAFTIDASAATVCSVAGSTVSFIGTGTCTINANQPGNAAYLPAPQMQQSFDVGPNLAGETYGVVGNTQLVAAGQSAPSTPFTASPTALLANDTADVPITVTAVTNAATTGGGQITIDADGKFTYTPPVGQAAGSDTYVYTGTANGVSRAATVTLNIASVVWFVDNASGAATHDGRSNTPFLDLGPGANGLGSALAGAGPATDAFIHVAKGSDTTTGAYAFKAGQTLVGAGATLSVGALSIPGNVANTPTLGGTLTLAASVTINGIDLGTGGADGIVGSGVSGVSVAVRNVTAAGGIPVNLVNSDGSFTFRSVSANGGANGIVWNNAEDATGLLTVTGDGSTNTCKTGTTTCSGGTIQNTTGDGVSLARSRVNLALMWIKNNANSGIKGTGVKGFTATDILVQNNTNAAGEQAGILLNDLADAAAAVTRAEVIGSTEDNVRVHNTAATGTITFSNATIRNNSAASGNIGIFLQTDGIGNLTGTVQNSTLNGNRTIALRADSADSSILDASFVGNIIAAGSPNQGNQGIEVSRAGTSTLTFDVAANTVSGLISTLINVFSSGGPGTGTGDVDGNTVTGTGPGGNQFGIRLFNSGSSVVGFGTLNVNVKNNSVTGIDNAYPILGEASGSTGAGGTLKLAVTGNTADVAAPDGLTSLDAIRVQARHTSAVCAKISDNTTNAGGSGFYGLQVRQADTGVFNLEGLTAGPQTDPVVQNFLIAQNPSAASVGPLSAVASGSINGVAAGSCGITP